MWRVVIKFINLRIDLLMSGLASLLQCTFLFLAILAVQNIVIKFESKIIIKNNTEYVNVLHKERCIILALQSIIIFYLWVKNMEINSVKQRLNTGSSILQGRHFHAGESINFKTPIWYDWTIFPFYLLNIMKYYCFFFIID